MSKILFVAHKLTPDTEQEVLKIKNICDSLNPENILPNPTLVFNENNIIGAISNPLPSVKISGADILFGQTFGDKSEWNLVEGPVPDGNFIIFRSSANKIEILNDILGTRSLWYYKEDGILIASTSQRAIIQYLESFFFNKNVIPWMLTNGMTGPELSWDKRISLLPPCSSLVLNRRDWSFEIKTKEITFLKENLTDKQHTTRLKSILEGTFSKLDLDYSNWHLSLSGGYDSRGNVLLLPKKDRKSERLRTITWGIKKAEAKKGSDAYVAKKIAKKFCLEHKYFNTDINENYVPVGAVLERFLKNGEGRIDHIGGYTDGFKIWKDLFERGVTGIIRGDEVFGSHNFISEFHLRQFFGLSVYKDYENLKDDSFLKSFSQELPEKYNRKKDESFEKWRDRLYQTFLIPTFLSALSDLKFGYLEQINPFLSTDVVLQIRKIPDHLRTDKRAFRTIVDDLNKGMNFASTSSVMSRTDFLEKQEVKKYILKEFDSSTAKSIFPSDFLLMFKEHLTNQNQRNLVNDRWKFFKTLIPKSIKKMVLKRTYNPKIEKDILAFRMFIIIKMVRIFDDDIIEIKKKMEYSRKNEYS